MLTDGEYESKYYRAQNQRLRVNQLFRKRVRVIVSQRISKRKSAVSR